MRARAVQRGLTYDDLVPLSRNHVTLEYAHTA